MSLIKPEVADRLMALYKEMAEITLPKCQGCPIPYHCCSPEYCEMTMKIARKLWGVELKPTGHERLPLMGPTGCTAEPHLRPVCSVHTCRVNALGFEPNDRAWNERYFKLREEIDILELELPFLS